MAAAQARRIAGALVGLMPQHENTLMRNLDSLVAELEQLDAGFAAIGERFGRQPLLASHPVYQYFARRYGFDLQSVHWEAEELPPLQEWQKLELLLEKHPAKWMIWEAQPLPEIHDGLSRLGVTPLVFQPLAHRPAHGDFLSAMKSNVQTLGQMLTVVP
jgi:zinc transport system substrate-binding protein